MVIMEMKEAAQERAFDLVEELHELGHEKKMILHELEDVLCECFDNEREKEESEEGKDLGFKSHSYAMRNFDKDDEDDNYPRYRRRSMRMRRNRIRG